MTLTNVTLGSIRETLSLILRKRYACVGACVCVRVHVLKYSSSTVLNQRLPTWDARFSRGCAESWLKL